MVQLRKSRKSFRKTRGRKTRQRKNEKRKSRKTRSTRKTGGDGESIIEWEIYQLASKIGELIKLKHDKEQKKKDASKKIVEIQKIFDWLIGRKLVSCGEDATCRRKKMIYYYIAVHLFMCFRKFIITTTNAAEEGGQEEKLITKFEKHRNMQVKNIIFTGDHPHSLWKSKGEPNFISGIVKTLYDSILEKNERAAGREGGREDEYYSKYIKENILTEVEEYDINVSEGNSIFVKWIEQIKNIKIIAKSAKNSYGEYNPNPNQITHRLEEWKRERERERLSKQRLERESISDDEYSSVASQ